MGCGKDNDKAVLKAQGASEPAGEVGVSRKSFLSESERMWRN